MQADTIIVNPESYRNKLNKIQYWGFDNMYFLADFDNTLTKKFVNWKATPSLISILRSENILWDEYSRKAYKLFNYYHKIEINPTISLEKKKRSMYEWWSKHLELKVQSWLSKTDIEKAVQYGTLEFRDGTLNFFQDIKNQVPFIIISANGLWDESIKIFFSNNNVYDSNIVVISNVLKWDINWKAIGYSKDIIHSFNKDWVLLESYPEIYEKIKNRKNIILLWDSLWDPYMSHGFEYENIIKIWFLNENEDMLLGQYKKLYDVIILNDGNFSFVNNLIQSIKNNT